MTEPNAISLCTDDRFSDALRRVRERASEGSLSLRQLLEVFGPKGHVLLIIFLLLPFLQPIPIPGVSTALGAAIALIGLFMMLDRPPWLPDRLARVTIQASILLRICSGLEALLARLESWVKPRGKHVFSHLWFKRLNGFALFALATFLSLPLPIPFSNFFPAVTLLIISLGLLEEDLRAVMVGYVMTIVTIAFFTALVVVPYLSIKAAQT